MSSIVGWALRFRLLVLAAAVAVMALGVIQLRDAAVDTLPEFTPPYAEIQTEALGLSADEVEQLITVPLEADLLNGVEGIDVIRSESVPGLSSIVLVFEPGTDIYRAAAAGPGTAHAGARTADTCPSRPSCCSPCPPRAGS